MAEDDDSDIYSKPAAKKHVPKPKNVKFNAPESDEDIEPQSENPIEAYKQLRKLKKNEEQRDYTRSQSVDKGNYRNQNYNSSNILFPSQMNKDNISETDMHDEYPQRGGRGRAVSQMSDSY